MKQAFTKLGLGTVQFGMNYGITNTGGIPSLPEIRNILKEAQNMGIRVLDTARMYGTSEEALGACLPPDHSFRIVTKTSALRKTSITADDAHEVQTAFGVSLKHLGQSSVYGLLIHQANDLLQSGGEFLVDVMRKLKENGLVQKIGVSIYTRQQAEAILDRFEMDIIQFPFSILDQRLLADDFLSKLHKRGIELHARSVFLQGVLLLEPAKLPAYFSPIRHHLEGLATFLKTQGLTPLQAALHFALNRTELATILLGVCSLQELRQIIDAIERLPSSSINWSPFAIGQEAMLDPTQWLSSGQTA